jgi:hypothetical protein
MKTDELITVLAAAGAARDPRPAARRYPLALAAGAVAALAMMWAGWGIRPDLVTAMHLPMFWVKLAIPAALAAAALLAARRLGRPGARLRGVPRALAAPVAIIWALAAGQLLASDVSAWDELVFGDSWAACIVSVAVLAIPALVALMWASKALAPTRLAAAGAAAGLAAGGVGAVVYALHCPEMTAPFIGSWYLLGMALPAALGAWIGPRALRW